MGTNSMIQDLDDLKSKTKGTYHFFGRNFLNIQPFFKNLLLFFKRKKAISVFVTNKNYEVFLKVVQDVVTHQTS